MHEEICKNQEGNKKTSPKIHSPCKPLQNPRDPFHQIKKSIEFQLVTFCSNIETI